MLGNHGRGLVKQVFTGPAKALARFGVTPNQVTVVGTVLSIAAAVGLLGTGQWIIGPIVLAVILFADSLDGTLARLTGSSSTFGAFLDSTLDRLSDGAVFGSLTFAIAMQYAPSLERTWAFIAGLISMIGAVTVSYARARAEAVGAQAKVGIAERTDRLIVGLVGAFLVGLGLPLWIMAIALSWVAFASLFTVAQRIFAVKRELSGK